TPTICKLILVDKSDNFLVGTTYHEDSIKLFTASRTIPLGFESGAIYFDFSPLMTLNNQDIMLKLSKNEVDTLSIFIRTYSNECWSSQILDTLKYNEKVINTLTGNTYKIIK
ncbi:MAG: hypothetical protein WCP32_15020, partial [Bacteroidota bacterium]